MVRGSQGHMTITGRVGTAQTGFDISAIRLDENLDLMWVATFDGNGLNDQATDLKVDADGNTCVCGHSTVGPDRVELVVIKYDSDGSDERRIVLPL